jgi:hypothetical protein
MESRQFISRGLGLLAGVVFVVAVVGLSAGLEPFATWFYSFAWWSYIVMADAVIFQRRRESLLMNRPLELPSLAAASVTCWLFFEFANFFLGNWHYQGLPEARLGRWLGYWLGFATVLPGIFQTRDLLDALDLVPRQRGRVYAVSENWPVLFILVGWLLWLLPLIWPRIFFSLVWLAPIFFLEPFCALGGGRSLWLAWCQGERREVYLLLLAGLLCGILWETWNFWAKAKWIYTLPYLHFGKVFEMPILGYLGFPPFAVACAVMYNCLTMLRQRWLTTSRARQRWLVIQVLFWGGMFLALDYRTVWWCP